MRKIVLALAASMLLCAQTVLPGFPPGMFSGRGALDASPAASYTGPGDLGFGTATAWFGFRCYTAAYSGNVADIFDAATGSTTETLITCDGHGNLVVTSPTAIATTCAAGCVVKTVYDQTGGTNCTSANCNVTQATNASRPTFLYQSASCGTNANLSCMQCPSSPAAIPLLSANALSSTSQTYYWSLVFYTSSASSQNYVGNGTQPLIQHPAVANRVTFNSGSAATSQVANENAWHSVGITFAGASSAINVDGSTTGSLNPGSTAASGKFLACAGASVTNPMTGFIAEWGMWPSTSTFNAGTLLLNQQSFYGGL